MTLAALSTLSSKGMFDAVEGVMKRKKGRVGKFPAHPLPVYVNQPRAAQPTQDLMPYVVAGALFGVL